ncbi:HNH endonuclease signature motif containing protein [Streptomyces sp. NPDC006544]|uniref:HNH endonuclease n=1 Tax=Streptomyces sp. NPDC006544 TaxID=3154583 RepID=UPI0033AEAD8B
MVLFAHNGRCVYCGAESRVMDHVIPLAGGGEDSSKNLVPACDDCNLSKGDSPLPQWIMRREFQLPRQRSATPLGDIPLLGSYQDAHQECVRTIRRVESTCLEIEDPERRKWFRKCFPEARPPRDRAAIDELRRRVTEQVQVAQASGFSTTPRPTRSEQSGFGDFSEIMDAFFGAR